jgi:uncharacterized protein YukE
MSDRVLSTGQARDAIQKLQRILSGDLQSQITELTNAANTLSQPDVWDGRLATQFRGDWPQQQRALTQAKEALQKLRDAAQKINQNIMQAGGNQ